MTPPPQPEKPRFGLPHALVVSVIVHVLLILITLWVPVGRQLQAEPESERLLRFDFAPIGERDSGAQEGQLPPQSAQAQPRALPDPPPPSPLPEPAAAEPPSEPAPKETPEAASAQQQESSQNRLPDHEAAIVPDRPVSEQASPEGTGPASPRLDVNRALHDFSRALARAREASPPAPRGSTGPSNVFVPDPTALPGTGFGVGNLLFESTDFDWSDYARQIYIAIWRAWHNRLHQTSAEFEKWSYSSGEWYMNHQTQVRFVIERSGEVSGIEIESESGCVPLDASAADALAEVILPPLPAEFPRDREVVHGRFLAIGEVRALRPTLRYLKQQGYF